MLNSFMAPIASKRRSILAHYTHWLHTQWPAGTVERLPQVREDGSTALPGVYITGDLTGVPLLKFSADTGAKAVQTILADPAFQRRMIHDDGAGKIWDLVIIGGGVSGMAAGLEAHKAGLKFEILEAAEPFSTLVNFPKGKPIYAYPTDMTPAGELQFKASIKEDLIEEVLAQTLAKGIKPRPARAERIARKGNLLEVVLEEQKNLLAHRVIVAIGRSGNFRKLNVSGEELNKVYNRLHDPRDFAQKNVLVVGGGDSALETAIAVAESGGNVTLSYRKPEFSRPKPDNIDRLNRLKADPMADVQVESPISPRITTAVGGYMDAYRQPGSIQLMMSSQVREIRDKAAVVTDSTGRDQTLANDAVFTMIGREPPLDFFRRSGIPIRGEWRWTSIVTFVLVLLAVIFLYHWKKSGLTISQTPIFREILSIGDLFKEKQWFPYNVSPWLESIGGAFNQPANLLGTLKISLGSPGFYYSTAYCLCVIFFGMARMRRRKTPYVNVQTYTLIAFQVIPLFLLPYLILPWMGHNGWFDDGVMKRIADSLFPKVNYEYGREYWRAFGLILAWPLFIWNVFTEQPMWGWLIISFIQTFVIIPAIIYYWGKGAYCGWICSCGALAETLGDAHRHKMPHGPFWNRFNMLGQIFLAFAFVLLIARSLAWIMGDNSVPGRAFKFLFQTMPIFNYVWFVDLLWAGIIGVGFYWHFSGRVWCRFACPLAALMHIYTRFSRFRILADKKKCISCNVCTSVCHQGIDVMNFANKGLAMNDPQCVRCSACVQSCPTGVLSFGQVDRKTGEILKTDPSWLAASPVQKVELRVNGFVLHK